MSNSPELELVDSHCHLATDEFEADRHQVVERAARAGVRIIVNVAYDVDSCRKALALAEAEPNLPCTVGLHPHEAKSFSPELGGLIVEMAQAPQVVAVGETGLDYFRMLSPRQEQLRSFRWHLELAARTHKPVVIHNRDADADVAEELARFGGEVLPILHCFSSTDPHYLEAMLQLKAMISFAGNLTYPAMKALRQLAALVPADRLLVETDAPYLPPQPWRGQRNEPAYLHETVRALAKALEKDPKAIARLTFQNALRTFGLNGLVDRSTDALSSPQC